MKKKRIRTLAFIFLIVLFGGLVAVAGNAISWTPNSPSAGTEVTFSFSGSDSETVQGWEFGDGASGSATTTVKHTYATSGTYDVEVET